MTQIIDRYDHSMLFDVVFKDAQSHGKDDFPSCNKWKFEIEKWLQFIQIKKQLELYLPRLNVSQKTKCDEALAEISSAYIMEVKLNFPVIDWERKTINDRDVDFIIQGDSGDIYCEVKSPGWESELEKQEHLNGRKYLPKHKNAEVRTVEPWQNIRYALWKSYPKFLPDCKNLVIIKDDLFISILDIPFTNNIDIALFEDSGNYNGEMGYFSNKNFENIGGVLFLDCRLINNSFEYRYKFVHNNNALMPFKIDI